MEFVVPRNNQHMLEMLASRAKASTYHMQVLTVMATRHEDERIRTAAQKLLDGLKGEPIATN